MLKNYLIVALRNLIKYKTYSCINIMGLSVGIVCCLLILMYVQDELAYDRFHEKRDRIYRLVTDIRIGGESIEIGLSPGPAGPALKDEFPQIKRVVRFLKTFTGNPVIEYGDNRYAENRFFFADPAVFEMFSFELVHGSIATVLSEPNTVVISEGTAQKYFGTQNPVGESLIFEDTLTFTVTGVVKKSTRSHIDFDFLASLKSSEAIYPRLTEIWGSSLFYTYIELNDPEDRAWITQQLNEFIIRHVGDRRLIDRFDLEPLGDIYLRSTRVSLIGPSGNITNVYVFSAISFFTLLIACMNFMNLSTARAMNRMREIGIRKILGAQRRMIFMQFLTESIVVTFTAMAVALILRDLLLPVFVSLSDKSIEMSYTSSVWIAAGLFTASFIIGVAAGSYPAVYFSGFQPMGILKGYRGSGQTSYRKMLVVFQFVISIVLIICTATVYLQLHFVKTKSLGLDKEQVVVVSTGAGTLGHHVDLLKTELRKNPNIQKVSASMSFPGGVIFGTSYRLEDHPSDDVPNIATFFIDEDFLSTYGIELSQGRNFLNTRSDANESFILNETAVRTFGWENPIGKRIEALQPTEDGYITVKSGKVIGVVNDFHYLPLMNSINPLILQMWVSPGQVNSLAIRIITDRKGETVENIESTMSELLPGLLLHTEYLDNIYAANYGPTDQLGRTILYFALLTIFIACLGLLGLSSFAAEHRTKEIGIRRVLGATIAGITGLLSREFVNLVLLANIIAIPIAWYLMNRWLENFAYRIEIVWWVFALAGGVALCIALVTMSFQTIKAARANPVESLRNE